MSSLGGGGWNKSHGTVEKTPRIDSYDICTANCETLFAYSAGRSLIFGYIHYYGPGGGLEFVKVRHQKDGWSQILELSRKRNGHGGSQTFFLCPNCGERRRYLYQVGAAFLCRECSRLNYRSQQETRSGTMYWYDKSVALVEKHLDTWPRVRPDGFEFCAWIPERPRYMHQATYQKYLRRFAKYQQRHQIRQMEDLARILRQPGL